MKEIKNTISILIVILILCKLSATAQKSTSPIVVPVGFYNLENLFDTLNDININDEDFLPDGSYNYNSIVYREKLHNLAKVISMLGTQVNSDGVALLGVSEVENKDVLEDLVSQESVADRKLKIVHFNSHDYRGIDCALLYNPKYFRVKSAKPLYLYINGEEYITRSVLWVRGLLLGEKVDVFVNHWPSRRGGEAATAYLRDSAAALVRHTMDSLINAGEKSHFLVMGDLNDDPVNESVTEVLDAKGSIEELQSPRDMYNPFYSYYKKGLGTTAYRDAWSLFDQIILGKDLVENDEDDLHYMNSEVFTRPFMTQSFGHFRGYPLRSFSNNQWMGGYSDHFPVLVYLATILKTE